MKTAADGWVVVENDLPVTELTTRDYRCEKRFETTTFRLL